MRHHVPIALLHAVVLAACGPDSRPAFAGSYTAQSAIQRCNSPDSPSSSTGAYGDFAVEIARRAHGRYEVQPPAIDCPLTGKAHGDELEFPAQDCPEPSNQRDISGFARWTDDDTIRIELDGSEVWPPAEFWPEGITWSCTYELELVPAE